MSRKLLLFTALLVIVGSVSFLFLFNPGSVDVTVFIGKTVNAPLALVLIVTFLAGFSIAGAGLLWVHLRHSFARRALEKRIELIGRGERLLMSAREALEAGATDKARATLQQILKGRPEDLASRLLLAQTLQAQGSTEEALALLEEGRQLQNPNAELLIRAAALSSSVGNEVATYDNLVIALKLFPESANILQDLVAVSRRLGRYDAAIQHQKTRLQLATADDLPHLEEELTSIEIEALLQSTNEGSTERMAGLEELVSRYPDYAPLSARLALSKAQQADLEAASRLLHNAYKLSGDVDYLFSHARLWLQTDSPNRAVAALRAAIAKRSSKHENDNAGKLVLGFLYFHLNSIDEARRVLQEIDEEELSESLNLPRLVLKAAIARQQGEFTEAYDTLRNVVDRLAVNHSIEQYLAGIASLGAPSESWIQDVKMHLRLLEQPSPALSHL